MGHALIIEDEPVIAFHMARLVVEAGATSIAFAQTDLQVFSAAIERKPEVIVSDVNLLIGTGPQAVTSIRGQLGRVPAIFVTGNPRALVRYDHDGVIEKPFDDDQLITAFARLAANR